MKEIEPLRRTGSAEVRALLESPPPRVADTLRFAILRDMEARLSPRGRRRRARYLVLAFLGSFVAGSALAYGVSRVLGRSDQRPLVETAKAPLALPAPQRSALPAPVAQEVRLAPAPPATDPRSPASSEGAPARPPDPRSDRAASSPPLGGPGLQSVADLWGLPGPDLEPRDLVPFEVPAPPALLLSRNGVGETRLVLAGPDAQGEQRIVGRIRNVSVSLTVSDAEISGRLGGHHVSLWLHGRRAEGTVAGRPVQFELARTRDGLALHGGHNRARTLPVVTRMLATSDRALSWFLGCNGRLVRIEAGVYQGRCQLGDTLRLELPPAWQRLPPLPRLVLLSLSLPDPRP